MAVRIVLWVIVAAAIGGPVGYVYFYEPPIEVTAIPLVKGHVEQTVAAISSGTVVADQDSMISGFIGTIASVPVAEGDRVEEGDLLISRSGTVGRSYLHVGDSPVTYAGYLVRFRPRRNVEPRFLFYWTKSKGFIDQVQVEGTQSTIVNVNAQKYANMRLPLPLPEAQRAIVGFLDRETERIDRLREKKGRLIELLEEKRTALISHAVTKGLDPTVPMKDSGIPWLGDIPAHWDARKIKFVARPGTGHTPSRQHPEYWENSSVPWFTLADVWQLRDGWMEVVTETSEMVSELGLANSSAVRHPAGTVFFSRTASVGFSGIMGMDMATSQDFVTWTCSDRIDPHYLLYIFRAMRLEFARLTMGSTHKTIYMPDAHAIAGPVPPKREQLAIGESIRHRTSALQGAIQRLSVQLDKLSEYRQALITAAVTGQIDVTNYSPDPEEAIA